MNPFDPYPMPKLTVELVPASQWNDNLRKMLPKSKWDMLRSACYKRARHNCECCGNLRGRPPEAHEIWDYDDHTRVQRLDGLVSLCYLCHRVKHLGFALSQGQDMFTRAINHLATINAWPLELAIEYADRQFQIHAIRSELTWTLDVTWLDYAQQYIDDSEAVVRQRSSKLAQEALAVMMRKRSTT